MFRNAFFSGGPTVFEGFNAGVLVMNLARMRRDRAVETTVALARTFGLHDQDVLNLTTRARRKPLAEEWNVFPELEMREDAALAHFVGPVKPWLADVPVPYLKEWRENAALAEARE